MLDLTARNDAKQRETTCGYANGVDGINTSSTSKRLFRPKLQSFEP
jgi:hypothetical protein